jgi:MFS transporter, putative metabolite:H+ symporter
MATPPSAFGRRQDAAGILARMERLPVSRLLVQARVIVGTATFFDGYTTLAIAYVLPVLARQWRLNPASMGLIISAGYLGQFAGAWLFGWLAERGGRLRVLRMTIALYAVMGLFCTFAWGPLSLMVFRFIQGIGTGGEVPVAAAYINELVGAKRRGRFFLLYEVIFPVGLACAGIVGYFLVPTLGWRAMFLLGALPAFLTVPLRRLLPESPRWLLAKGRTEEAERVVKRIESDLEQRGVPLPQSKAIEMATLPVVPQGLWRDLFKGVYRQRTLMLAGLWLAAYMVNNGLITWLPTLYTSIFDVPLKRSLGYGFFTTGCGVAASICCALYIDRVGRRKWYIYAFFGAAIPLASLALLGGKSALQVLALASCAYGIIQTITFSLYLYSAELYPTHIRALGVGMGSAFLRIGSSLGPGLIGAIAADRRSIGWVFVLFCVITVGGGVICSMFAVETKGRVLEELSPNVP